MDPGNKAKVKKFKKEGQDQFIAALDFNGLNHVTYANVKSDVHNGWLVQGVDTMPMCIDQMIRLCNRYDHRRMVQAIGTNTTSGIVCIQ